MSRRALLVVGAALLLAAGGAAFLLTGTPGHDNLAPASAAGTVIKLPPGVTVIPAAKRRPLPEFTGPGVRGERLSVAALRGKPLVLNFWASWCGWCRGEQPALEQASKELAGSVGFVGVNFRDAHSAALAYLDEYHVTYPSLYDPSTAYALRLGDLGPTAPPYTLLVDAHGRIAARIAGTIAGGQGGVAVQVGWLRDLIGQVGT